MWSFLRQNFRWIGGGFLLTYFSSFGQTFFVSGSVAEWQAAFDLSHGEFGRLYMIATLASALTLPFIGRLVDVIPEHRMVAIVIPVLAIATALAAYAPSIFVLVLAIYLLRLFGQGMMTQIALTAIGRWYAAQRGRAISLVVLGHQGGEATLPALFTVSAVVVGWQGAWLLGSLALLLIALPLAVWSFRLPRHPKGHVPGTDHDVRSWSRGEVMRDPIFWILLTGVLAPPFIGTTIFFHQDYLTALHRWPVGLFASGFTLMAITTLTFALICGALIDRFSARRVLPLYLLPLSLACLTAGTFSDGWSLYAFMMLLGISYGFSSTLFGSLWPEIYGTEHLGAIRSIIIPFMVLATAVGPGLTGTLIDDGTSLPDQLLVMGIYCLIVIGLMVFASHRLSIRQKKDQPEAGLL